jgi:anti-sigma factor RsiW
MKECWGDGELRAYLDGELAPSEMARIAAHLAECHACEARYDEVAGRAGMVSGLMESLAELEPAVPIRRRQPVRRWRQWAGAGAAIAAGIAIAAMMIPKGPGPGSRQVMTPVPETSIAGIAPVPTPAPVISEAAVQPQGAPSRERLALAARARLKLAAQKPKLPRDVFIALDDEPMETGVVVRMTLGEEEIPADVVFGKDGRARAVRLIGTESIH